MPRVIPEVKNGQRVKVTFTGTVKIVHPEKSVLAFEFVSDLDSREPCHTVYRGELSGVEVIGPQGWPPQIGDVWEADGTEYAAYCSYPGELRLASLDIPAVETYSPEQFKRDFKAQVLVRRRGE